MSEPTWSSKHFQRNHEGLDICKVISHLVMLQMQLALCCIHLGRLHTPCDHLPILTQHSCRYSMLTSCKPSAAMSIFTGYTGRGVSLTSRPVGGAEVGKAANDCVGKLTKLENCRCWELMAQSDEPLRSAAMLTLSSLHRGDGKSVFELDRPGCIQAVTVMQNRSNCSSNVQCDFFCKQKASVD